MSFKESYLIPKDLYHSLNPDFTQSTKKEDFTQSTKKEDLKIKDFKHRFKPHSKKIGGSNSKLAEEILNYFQASQPRKLGLLDAISDPYRRALAGEILQFINNNAKDVITIKKDLSVQIDGETIPGLDARDALAHLVGQLETHKQTSYKLYDRLLELGIKPHLLKYFVNTDFQAGWKDEVKDAISDEQASDGQASDDRASDDQNLWDTLESQKQYTKLLGETRRPRRRAAISPISKWYSHQTPKSTRSRKKPDRYSPP